MLIDSKLSAQSNLALIAWRGGFDNLFEIFARRAWTLALDGQKAVDKPSTPAILDAGGTK
jgi:hypothetical protein